MSTPAASALRALRRLLDDGHGLPVSASIHAIEGVLVAHLQERQLSGELNKSVAELAGSYVHMHLNRLFRSAANAQEMVLYDFLARTYQSRIAQQKQG